MSEITSKWKLTGLLEQTPDDKKDMLANKLEKLVDILKGDELKEIPNKEQFAGLVIPSLVRVINDGDSFMSNIDEEWFCLDLLSYMKQEYIPPGHDTCHCYCGMDHEAEFVDQYCKTFIERMKL